MRQFANVYVEIPPSPLHRARSVSNSHVSTLTSNRKENAPLPRGAAEAQAATPTSLSRKRKLSEQSNMQMPAAPQLASSEHTTKKTKLVPEIVINLPLTAANGNIVPNVQALDADNLFPNGSFYCHQCGKKRDALTGIQCTMNDPTNRRCKVKFCPSCLTNRYGENIENIKNASQTQARSDPAHIANAPYTWKCTKCRDICNCARCRKAKGLEPTGNLTTVARRAGGGSAADMLSADPARVGILPGKGQQVTPSEKKPGVRKAKEAEASASASTGGAADGTQLKPKPKPKPRVLPTIEWSRIPLEGTLSLAEAEARIQIREFVLRFACIMQPRSVAKKELEELDEIGGETGKGGWNSGGEEDGDGDVVGWVSEMCVRGMAVGLLGLVHDDEANARDRKLIAEALEELRASGANLTKVWAALSSLRDSLVESPAPSAAVKSLSNLPDPLPPPPSASRYNTRTTRNATIASVFIAQSTQLVPVLSVLTEAALRTELVRAELEGGVKEGKEKLRESKELMKNETERWDKIKEKETNHKCKEAKERREEHKGIVFDLEETLKVAMNAYAVRFDGPLGKDMDGRVYWALSPGVTEREHAIQAIFDGDHKGKKPKRAVPENREMLKKWSWFVAVSGPAQSEAEDDQACWWGIWDPAQIKMVADWIEIRAEGEDGAERGHGREIDGVPVSHSPLSHELAALVRGLRAYAGMLEWRSRRDEDSSGDQNGKASGSTAISTSKFYC